VNLRFSKWWRFGKHQKVTFFFEGRNIFNHKNYRRVNPFTGDGYKIGDNNPEWVDREGLDDTDNRDYALGVVNPSYIENPRVLLWGVTYSW